MYKMNIGTKVMILNDLTDGTLGMTFYGEWVLTSYGSNSLFSMEGSIGHIEAKGFSECINKAFDLAIKKGDELNGKNTV